jgi:hypothetical protein
LLEVPINATHERPETQGVAMFQQVAELVENQIRYHRRRKENGPPVEVEAPGVRARRPTEAEVHHSHLTHLDTDTPLERGQPLSQPSLRLSRIPTHEALPAPTNTVTPEMKPTLGEL